MSKSTKDVSLANESGREATRFPEKFKLHKSAGAAAFLWDY